MLRKATGVEQATHPFDVCGLVVGTEGIGQMANPEKVPIHRQHVVVRVEIEDLRQESSAKGVPLFEQVRFAGGPVRRSAPKSR